jgi:hypothetical protein
MFQPLSWSPFERKKRRKSTKFPWISWLHLCLGFKSGLLTGAPAQLPAADRGDSSILTMFGRCSANVLQMLAKRWLHVDYVQIDLMCKALTSDVLKPGAAPQCRRPHSDPLALWWRMCCTTLHWRPHVLWHVQHETNTELICHSCCIDIHSVSCRFFFSSFVFLVYLSVLRFSSNRWCYFEGGTPPRFPWLHLDPCWLSEPSDPPTAVAVNANRSQILIRRYDICLEKMCVFINHSYSICIPLGEGSKTKIEHQQKNIPLESPGIPCFLWPLPQFGDKAEHFCGICIVLEVEPLARKVFAGHWI